jgi:hypothetical protein
MNEDWQAKYKALHQVVLNFAIAYDFEGWIKEGVTNGDDADMTVFLQAIMDILGNPKIPAGLRIARDTEIMGSHAKVAVLAHFPDYPGRRGDGRNCWCQPLDGTGWGWWASEEELEFTGEIT